jgi:hypothetical protein
VVGDWKAGAEGFGEPQGSTRTAAQTAKISNVRRFIGLESLGSNLHRGQGRAKGTLGMGEPGRVLGKMELITGHPRG